MPLKSIVKVSHLSNLSDARYCAGMGVEMLGFQVISGQKHYIPSDVFQDIRGWVSGPAIIAELYGITSAREIESALQTYAPDYFELSMHDYRMFRRQLPRPSLVSISSQEDLALIDESDAIKYLIADEKISCLDVAALRLPVLVRIPSIQKLEQRSGEGCFQGYVLEGPQQIRPGITNYEELGGILEALEDEG